MPRAAVTALAVVSTLTVALAGCGADSAELTQVTPTPTGASTSGTAPSAATTTRSSVGPGPTPTPAGPTALGSATSTGPTGRATTGQPTSGRATATGTSRGRSVTTGGTGSTGGGADGGASASTTHPPASSASWRRIFADEFNGPLSTKSWYVYTHGPASSSVTDWKPSHVVVQGGNLAIRAYQENGKWVNGGLRVTNAADGTAYGRYLVRFRIDKARGVKHVALLWPDSEKWPADGEIDFSEDQGGNRLMSTAALVTPSAPIKRTVSTDLSQWHVMGVDWTPNQLVYTIDGREWGRVNSPLVPRTPHHLALQTQVKACGSTWDPCPDATTPPEVDMEIDWVAIYRPA